MRFAKEISLADRELTRIKNEVAHADTAALSALMSTKERAATIRAVSYVWLAAMLERVVRDSIKATLREITARAPALKDIRLSLFALLCDSEFESMLSQSKNNAWRIKIALLQRTVDAAPALFADHVLPVDKRTIRAEHFDAIWLVLGLPNDSTPSPVHRFALKELAEGRNEVAHGHQDPVSFGRLKATADLLNLANRIDDVIMHLLTGLDEYMERRVYERR